MRAGAKYPCASEALRSRYRNRNTLLISGWPDVCQKVIEPIPLAGTCHKRYISR